VTAAQVSNTNGRSFWQGFSALCGGRRLSRRSSRSRGGRLFAAEEQSPAGETFESIECNACRQFHNVNPATGRVLGQHK
jgi:hypothetical protein